MYCTIVRQTQKLYVQKTKTIKKQKYMKVLILKRRECPDPTFDLCTVIVYISHSGEHGRKSCKAKVAGH